LPFSVPEAIRVWLYDNGFETLDRCDLIGSGHHECYLLSNQQDEKLVAKVSGDKNGDALIAESRGLTTLSGCGSLRTPEILTLHQNCLLLEYIAETTQQSDYWQELAHGLVKIHQQSSSDNSSLNSPYGLDYDNYCGAQMQKNGWYEDGHDFFAEQRLLHQARIAFDNGLLESPWVIQIESICARLADLVPWQSASLLHGDLWPGNILVDEIGKPALIDPAIYFGWREADLAMSLLFGGLPHEFYVAYEQGWPLEKGWRSRVPLYNLYHLLNHLNIFGESYLPQVVETTSRYA